MRATRTAFLFSRFQPVRIFSVTGTGTAATTASTIAADQRLVLQQRRTGRDVADLFRRAAHVDVDDLRAALDVVASCLGHHRRIGTGDLHNDRLDLAAMVGASQGLGRVPQLRIRGDHFGHREPGAQALAQLAKRPVGDARHRRDDQGNRNVIRADLHGKWLLDAAAGNGLYRVCRAIVTANKLLSECCAIDRIGRRAVRRAGTILA